MKKIVHVVGAIIENENHKIFCAKRSPQMVLPNYWEFPGGKIEKGETPQKALEREIKEEFNCTIAVDDKFEDTTYEYEHIFVRLETYKARLIDNEPTVLEHSEARWMTREEIKTLEFAPADVPAVQKLIKEKY